MKFEFLNRITIADDVLVRELDGESILLNLNNESYYGLDDVGTQMWNVMGKSTSLEEAFNKLLAEYDVEPEQLRSDLQTLVEELIENGLVRLENGSVS